MFDFASSYAEKSGDDTFNARLALGLARSLASFTRFILDRKRAKAMFLRLRYILERLMPATHASLSEFDIPREILVD